MLGSAADAEDALQETLLRAWRGIAGFEGRSSLATWLYRIATNTCLNAIKKRRHAVLPVDFGPTDGGCPEREAFTEPWAAEEATLGLEGDGPPGLDGVAERRELVEDAVRAAVEELPVNQRAALILRDVLGFSARDGHDWEARGENRGGRILFERSTEPGMGASREP